MKTEGFEAAVRDALSRHAETVSPEQIANLSRVDFRPHARLRSGVAASMVGALVVAGLGAYVIGTQYHSQPVPPHGPGAPAGPELRLAGITITLPTGTRVDSRGTLPGSCEPAPPPTPGAPETVAQAGGQFTAVDGGCLNINLGPPGAPDNARPIDVGTYNGYLVDNPPANAITLYVEVFTDHDVVFKATGTGMSDAQLVTMAEAAMPPCSPDREDAAPCSSRT